MEFLTATILSGIAYDILKHGVVFSAENIKKKLGDWVIKDNVSSAIADELKSLHLTNELSELAIERKIERSSELISLMKNIKPILEKNTVIQIHYGTGDIVGRDKIVK